MTAPIRVPHCVYRAYDQSGVLLYVGCTNNLRKRMWQHGGRAPWFRDMVRLTEEWHPDYDTARTHERRAIVRERPVHNVAYAGRRWELCEYTDEELDVMPIDEEQFRAGMDALDAALAY
jgi:predicted GIY-YIG superfamily endonuclease